MATGKIKFFNDDRGFGFITPDDGGKDVFIHIKEAMKSGVRELHEGDKVSYEVTPDERSGRLAASNIGLL